MSRISIFKFILIFTLAQAFTGSFAAQETARQKEIDRLFETGNARLWEKKFPQAIADFQKIIRLDPTNDNARFSLAKTYVKSGAYDEGIREIEAYIQKVAGDAGAFALLAEAHLGKGKVDPVIEFLNEKIAGEKFGGYFELRAKAYLKKNLIDEAISDYTKALEQDGDSGYLFQRAALYARKGDQKAAVKDYLAFLEMFPDYEKARREASRLGAAETDLPARVQPKTEKPNAAVAALFQTSFDRLVDDGMHAGLYFFGQAAAADPRLATPLYYRGQIYDTENFYAEAFEEFTKAYARAPNFVEPQLKYAERVLSNGYFEIALSRYERVLEINSQDARAFAGRGAALVERSQIFDLADSENINPEFVAEKIVLQKQALHEFNKALELNPKLADVYFDRGKLHYDLGKLNEAVADYTAAIANSRSELTTEISFHRRGLAYCSLGEAEKASADETRGGALEPCKEWAINQTKKPETAEDWLKRGFQMMLDKNFPAAVASYDNSLKIKETAEALINRSRVYLLAEHYDAANADLSGAIRLNPNSAEAYKFRAVLYQLQNKNKEAISDFSTLLKLKPDNAFYYASRADLYAKTNQTVPAIADYAKAIGIESNYEGEFRIRRGDLYLQQKNYQAAINDFNVAVEEMPLRIFLYPKRAAALCALGKKAAARADEQIFIKHGGRAGEFCK